MELYRLASDFLFLECSNIKIVKNCVSEIESCIILSFAEALKNGNEGGSVIFLRTPETINNIAINEEEVIYADKDALQISTVLFEMRCRQSILKIHTGPKFIIMRYFENADPVIDKLLENIPFTNEIKWESSLERGRSQNTCVIALTKNHLTKNLTVNDLYSRMVLVKQPLVPVLRQLRQQGLCFATCSLNNNQWHELKIVIYDSDNETMKHYKRLIDALSKLEAVMILSENWTKDHPFIMVTVMAYQINILSLHSPSEIKKFLIGLEYNNAGERIVDFDLYYGKKKISWTDKSIKNLGRNRDEIGMILNHRLRETI